MAQAVRVKVAQQSLGAHGHVAAAALVHVVDRQRLRALAGGHQRAGLVHLGPAHALLVHQARRVAGRQGQHAIGVAHLGHVGQGGIGAKALPAHQHLPIAFAAQRLQLGADLFECHCIGLVVGAPARPGHLQQHDMAHVL